MATTVAQYQTHLDNARIQLAAGAYSAAKTHAMAALATIAGIADGQDASAQFSFASARATVLALIDQIDKATSQAALDDLSTIFGQIKHKRVNET